MRESSLISITMPAYNAANYIRESIDSILAQSYTNFELLIADDGSTDNTKEIIDSYKDKRIKVFHNNVNLGYLKTSNKLFALSKGKYITTQDADDISNKDRLMIQIQAFEKDDYLGACLTAFSWIDENGQMMHEGTRKNIKNADFKKNAAFFNGTINTIMLQKDVYNKVGGYNLYFDRIGSEDLFWLGIIARYYKIIYIDKILFYHRINPNSFTKNIRNKKQLISRHLARYFILKGFDNSTNLIENTNILKLENHLLNLYDTKLSNLKHYFCIYSNFKKFRIKTVCKLIMEEFSLKEFIYFVEYLIKNKFLYKRYFLKNYLEL